MNVHLDVLIIGTALTAKQVGVFVCLSVSFSTLSCLITVLPELTPSVYKPQTVSVQQHDLQLRWRNWPAYVSPNMELRYRLQYKEVLSQVVFFNCLLFYFFLCLLQIDTWSLIREFKADLKLETQEVDVNQLRENTYYIFRVVPVLVVNVGNPIEGSPSLPSSSVRTLCGGNW